MYDFNQAYGNTLQPQGFLGGLVGAPLGGLIGRGIGGLFGNAGLGHQIGQVAGGIGGGFLPFGADPISQAAAQQAQQQQLQQQYQQQIQQQQLLQQLQQLQQQQQQIQQLLQQHAAASQQGGQQAIGQQGAGQQGGQLGPQGWFGNLIGQVAQPLGGAVGGLLGHRQLGQQIGGFAGQLGGMLPFSSDPLQAAFAQQQQAQLAQAIAAQQSQGGQFAPQGFFGNLIGHVAQPLGGAIGGLFGQRGIGNTVGGIAGQLGSMLPFNADPMLAAYAQQQQWQQAQGGFAPPTLH